MLFLECLGELIVGLVVALNLSKEERSYYVSTVYYRYVADKTMHVK